MILCSCQPWISTLDFAQKCRTQTDIDQIHAKLITTGLIKNSKFTAKLILKLSNSPHLALVRFANYLLFSDSAFKNSNNIRDPFVWNSIIKPFSHGNVPQNALKVFILMLENGVLVDKYSFSLVLKACSRLGLVKNGMQIHGLLKKFEFGTDLFLENCLTSMYIRCGYVGFGRQVFDRIMEKDSVSYNSMMDGYIKCGMIDFARQLFDSLSLEIRNLITWNTMLSGYAKSEHGFELAWVLFEKMPRRDVVSWNLMIDCCLKNGKLKMAEILFQKMPEKDVASWAIMVDGYSRIGNIDVARGFFDEMPERDVISCNAMMAAYVRNGYFKEAMKIYHDMLSRYSKLTPDTATLLIALSAAAQLGNIEGGVSVHHYMKQNGFVANGKLGVALIDMYAKCGSIDCAVAVFENTSDRRVDHWNALIGGLAVNGSGELAFEFFMEMKRLSVKPDEITFIAVLNAAGHAGMVKEGIICFEIMRRVYKLEPKLQHYGCIVDILSRAGQIEEARRFVSTMPMEPNAVILRTLLSACKNHKNLSIGVPVAEDLIGLNSFNPSSYVLLSNMCAQFGLWDYVKNIRRMMKEKDVKKFPGCSWIELEGTVHQFFVGDTSHHQVSEIFSTLYRDR